MSKLKELTWAHHQAAERRKFAKELLSGSIDPKLYHKFLTCQYMNYNVLEQAAIIPPHLNKIKRARRIFQDIRELEDAFGLEPDGVFPPSVNEYAARIGMLQESDNNHGLLAHMYVRHFGELHGGQMIKKRNPGSGKMYEFNDVEQLKTTVRKMLHDDMADEANICFQFAMQLFEELESE